MHEAAFTLDGGPRSVQVARGWVNQVCRDLGHPELVESAELAVSEVVTNAVLHGSPPVVLRVGGTSERPRFEVSDGSANPPHPPRVGALVPPGEDLDALLDGLASFGRGLALVAQASVAWGADIDDIGKTVWFEPASELADDAGAPFQLTGTPAPASEPRESGASIVVDEVPVAEFERFGQHYRELSREIRLLSLARQADFPQAAALSSYFDALEVPLRSTQTRAQIEAALAAGRTTTALALHIPTERVREIASLPAVLDAADEFCRNERLLTLARTDEQRNFQNWFIKQIDQQLGDRSQT